MFTTIDVHEQIIAASSSYFAGEVIIQHFFLIDEEILEALASAAESLSSAHKNLETVAKRYLVKIHRPKASFVLDSFLFLHFP